MRNYSLLDLTRAAFFIFLFYNLPQVQTRPLPHSIHPLATLPTFIDGTPSSYIHQWRAAGQKRSTTSTKSDLAKDHKKNILRIIVPTVSITGVLILTVLGWVIYKKRQAKKEEMIQDDGGVAKEKDPPQTAFGYDDYELGHPSEVTRDGLCFSLWKKKKKKETTGERGQISEGEKVDEGEKTVGREKAGEVKEGIEDKGSDKGDDGLKNRRENMAESREDRMGRGLAAGKDSVSEPSR